MHELKSSFAQTRLEYLGHIVSENEIPANREKIRAIMQLPEPTSKKDVHKLSGLCSYSSSLFQN